jgi:hypothetical protein
MSIFEGSSNKALIRQLWDLPIVRQWSERCGHPLSYFGLPGPSIEDILDWRSYLGYCTGVERLRDEKKEREEDLNVHRLIHKNVLLNEIDEFQLLLGYVENIILDGVDQVRIHPRMSTNEHPLVSSFHYDLVNLDFLGGMGYKKDKKTKKSRRVEAIKKLLERQRETNFLFMLTLNVRDQIDGELIRYLIGAKQEIGSQQLQDILDWYVNCGRGMKEYRLKATVPLFIRKEGEVCGFDCFCYPPIAYIGSGSARMVHFIFELTDTDTILHAHSKQKAADVMKLPLIAVKDGRLQVPIKQHPHFDFGCCEKVFDFLPDNTKLGLLTTSSSENS